MDQKPTNEPDIVYSEAEPIEVESQPINRPRMEAPQYRVYSSQGCGPCCGPVGCLAFVLLPVYLLSTSQALRDLAMAGLLTFALISVMLALTKRKI